MLFIPRSVSFVGLCLCPRQLLRDKLLPRQDLSVKLLDDLAILQVFRCSVCQRVGEHASFRSGDADSLLQLFHLNAWVKATGLIAAAAGPGWPGAERVESLVALFSGYAAKWRVYRLNVDVKPDQRLQIRIVLFMLERQACASNIVNPLQIRT